MRKIIEIGERFTKVGTPRPVWKVHRLVVDQEGLRHFRLQDEQDPSKTILISERALLNRRFFRPAP
ncbi:MAG TPA: hypothetical protein VKY65_20025 [Alphaproteobacteria bacterium]|nr:hypothetical protein [Alphaproteobacteria bacterium]